MFSPRIFTVSCTCYFILCFAPWNYPRGISFKMRNKPITLSKYINLNCEFFSNSAVYACTILYEKLHWTKFSPNSLCWKKRKVMSSPFCLCVCAHPNKLFETSSHKEGALENNGITLDSSGLAAARWEQYDVALKSGIVEWKHIVFSMLSISYDIFKMQWMENRRNQEWLLARTSGNLPDRQISYPQNLFYNVSKQRGHHTRIWFFSENLCISLELYLITRH